MEDKRIDIDQLLALLAQYGVTPKSSLQVQTGTHNFVITDNKSFVAKAATEPWADTSLLRELKASQLIAHTRQSLLPSAILFKGHAVVVWEFLEARQPEMDELNDTQVLAPLVDQLGDFYTADTNLFAETYEIDTTIGTMERRLRDAFDAGVDVRLTAKLRTLVNEFVLPVVNKFGDYGSLVLTHSDVHAGNILLLNQLKNGHSLQLIDYESVGLGPIEYDAMGFYQYVVQGNGRTDIWDKFKPLFVNKVSELGYSFSDDTLNELLLFKNNTIATYHLMKGYIAKAEENTNILLQSIDTHIPPVRLNLSKNS